MNQTSPQSQPYPPAELSDEEIESMADFSATSSHTIKAEAVEKAQQFRSYAGEKAIAFKEGANEKLRLSTEKAKELHSVAEEYVREHPTKSVIGALSLGVIVGLILRK